MYLNYPERVLLKLQKEEKEILKDIHNACEKYGIHYFVAGGTLLGTIRHHDMIPWDDDIDLGMLREEYDKFIQIFPEALGDKYELIAPETENRYYSFIPKVALKGTRFIKDEALRSNVEIGIYAEIFVFENVSLIKGDIEKQIKKVTWTKYLYSIAQTKQQLTTGSAPVRVVKDVIKKGIRIYEKASGLNQKALNERFLNQTSGRKETGWVTHFGDGTTMKNIIRKDSFEPYTLMPMDDFEVRVPNNWEQFLKQLYGNYMQLPKEEDRWNQAPVILKFSDGEEIDFRKIESEE